MRERIDHSRPLVYEFRDLKTADVLVFDDYGAARAQFLRADPSHECEIIARNVRCDCTEQQKDLIGCDCETKPSEREG